ncbi:radical SAM protein [Niastella caeni]|uniref:Radical SAM protein n=1 Tax=Niastella caeni TaxID=2569763 RepID=A0A4V4GZJ6_9BACT|nr:radical SAM protein [Niastella caeni]THU32986.1 radical SAM protein [Niastella caeni]
MEPKTNRKFDKTTFDRQVKRIEQWSNTRKMRLSNPAYYIDIPQEISIQLTYACNLRCKMCYQWNETGYLNSASSAKNMHNEIAVDLFEKILEETLDIKSSLYIWGGEPLFHSNFEGISKALEKDLRYTTMCTNGLLIQKNMDSLLRISSNLALLISIDGLGDTNNELRGKLTFERVMTQISDLFTEQKKGTYKGTISINAVLNDSLAPHIYEFMEFFDDLGVDSVYFNYPWYISPQRAYEMDKFYNSKLAWIEDESTLSGTKSWHSFNYKLSPDSAIIVQEQIQKLKSRIWNSRVRFQQHMQDHEILDFIIDSHSSTRSCFAWSSRIEILADGRAGTCCKFFPELSIGNIKDYGLLNLWRSDKFNKLRHILGNGLLPICSKCILLYRNGY